MSEDPDSRGARWEDLGCGWIRYWSVRKPIRQERLQEVFRLERLHLIKNLKERGKPIPHGWEQDEKDLA